MPLGRCSCAVRVSAGNTLQIRMFDILGSNGVSARAHVRIYATTAVLHLDTTLDTMPRCQSAGALRPDLVSRLVPAGGL